MPKTVPCPVCRSDVKAPRDAEPGTVLTCPDCDERFTPPHLKKKGYDPEEEDAYDVGGDPDDDVESVEQVEKRRKTKAIREAGRQHAQGYNRKLKPALFGPTDIVLLIIAIAAALGAGVGLVLAKKAPAIGMMAVIIVAFCFMMFLFAYRKIMMRK